VRPALAAVAAAALSLLLAAACGGDSSDVPSDLDPRALLDAAAARMEQVQSFHFALEHEHGATEIALGLQMLSADGDIAGPDRMQLNAKAKAGPLNVEIGIVILPDASYITNPITGRWQKEDLSVASFFDPGTGVTALMRSAQSPRVTKRQQVNGVDTYVVEAEIDSGDLDLFAADAPAGQTLRARAWIGVDDPLAYRVEITGAVTSGEAENLVRRLELSRFDQPIEISAPR
jgi:hypothetical protein